MYLPSNTPLLQGQRERAALEGVCSDRRIEQTRRLAACGRIKAFRTLITPEQVMDTFGIGAAVDTAKLQAQSLDSRATILSGTGGTQRSGGPTLADLMANAPEVVSLNAQPDQAGCSDVRFSQRRIGPDPTPGMPHRAPHMVQSDYGTMYFRGEDSTEVPGSVLGLTGYAPSWSDAWVMPDTNANGSSDTGVGAWIKDHPWLSLAIAGAGLYALNQRKARR